MRNKTARVVGLASAIVILACAAVSGGEVERQVQASMGKLSSRAQEVRATLRDTLGQPFDEQVATALEDLRKQPLSLTGQLKVVNLMLARTDKLADSLRDTKQAELPALRDRVVKGLQTLSEAQEERADRFASRASNAKGAQRERYQNLSKSCQRFAQAYALRAEQYAKIPVAQQVLEVQRSLEYLDSVKEVLISLRDGIIPIISDEASLQELMRLSVTIEGVEQSLEKFSELVLAGALAPDASTAGLKSKR